MHTSHAKFAVVGMAVNVPGATTLEQFWENIVERRIFLKRTREDEGNTRFIRGTIDIPKHDHLRTLGVTFADLKSVDPQYLIFLAIAYLALQNLRSSKYMSRNIGVFASAGVHNQIVNVNLSASEIFSRSYLNSSDCLATYTSHKLDLTGPSLSVQTACSSSLVAIHQACNSLSLGECDIAIAGGVNFRACESYNFQEGMIFSKSGACRPFSKNADGTIESDGAGAIVIKQYEKAIQDDDNIYCTIVGRSINNDGATKVAFAAPSLEGQVDVYRRAISALDIDPASVRMIEAHGTGTLIGDAIELQSLENVYGQAAAEPVFVGSIKANIGHLYQAAGVVGFIKAALSLCNRYIPAGYLDDPALSIFMKSSHLKPALGLPWLGPKVGRAAVTSLGVGGTNAHLIIERDEISRNGVGVAGRMLPSPEASETGLGPKACLREVSFYRKTHLPIEAEISVNQGGKTLLLGSKEDLLLFDRCENILCCEIPSASVSTMTFNEHCEVIRHVFEREKPERVINTYLLSADEHVSLAREMCHFAATLRVVAETSIATKLVVLAANGEWSSHAAWAVTPVTHACIALAKTLELENRNIAVRVVCVTDQAHAADALAREVDGDYSAATTIFDGKVANEASFESFIPDQYVEEIKGQVIIITGGEGKLSSILKEHYGYCNKVISFQRSARDFESTQHEQMIVDVADAEAMKVALEDVRIRYGRVDYILHTAGFTKRRTFMPVSMLTAADVSIGLGGKVGGAIVLGELARRFGVKRTVFFSSIASVLFGTTFGVYSAANRFLDAAARMQGDVVSICLDTIRRDDSARGEPALSVDQFRALIDLALVIEERNFVVCARSRSELSTSLIQAARNSIIGDERDFISSEKLIAVLNESLETTAIDVSHGLRDIGLDSLMILDVIDKLKEEFGITLSIRQILECDTVSDLLETCRR